ncbi:transmembrane protein 135 isoform X2 [Tribolium castaneum]|uniref:transmembrane protein 135 isoform X2 n=1 Tax=Tribolium castaneum TaxID=7070 RepID=UPI00046C00E1|nr:PREDICTED: transmembrane protein 135 isoform X2 [Tribolium castaneum]|eukprot:XP_008191026.1 PREDICTED: transmembrane protein 135 isoform X2 [Tribolium castaneum]
MVQVLSKFQPLTIECREIHNWQDVCVVFHTETGLNAVIGSLKMYIGVYLLTLLMKGRIPTKEDLKKTVLGILQSTAFLSGTGFGYSLFLCVLRRLLGNFNILTVSAIPAFLSSVFSILIERPSRRTLLCLYVSNVATETLWNMALSRKMVRNVKYGDTAIFAVGMAVLLMYYKGGYHKDSEGKADSMFGVLRFVVGPYEEKDYSARSSQASTFYRQQVQNIPNVGSRAKSGSWHSSSRSKNPVFHVITQALRVYKKIIYKIKCCDRHLACPHPFSCLYYTMQGVGKMFSIGLGIQVTLKLVLNIKKVVQSPRNLKAILFRKDTLNLAVFLGGFSGLFRAVLCILRRATGKDSPSYAIPAGLIAGTAFTRYPDTTVSLYVMWKLAQITYIMGINKGIVPRVPGFTEFLYCFSTAVLFHAALLEPTNLRPSYWKFLHSISGGRIACMNRIPLDAWGLGTSESLERVLELTKTQRVLK